MTFLSVAQACRRLGIDAKTLRRWLEHAQLPLEPHPRDGRKKGVRSEHLLLLATLHHRALSALPEAAPPPAELAAPLSAEGLALPETLCALQAQIITLQQQMATLTHLLQQHALQHASPAAQAQPKGAAKRPPKPAPPALRSRPTLATIKPPHKAVHVLPLVESAREGHYVVICPQKGRLALEPDSPAWFAWLETQSAFRFVGQHGRFTAHHEVVRVPHGAWRAHRHIRNHSYTLRLGLTQDLTMAVLEQVAATLQAHLT
jgi:transposase-like protein